jgi:hypothetical protein
VVLGLSPAGILIAGKGLNYFLILFFVSQKCGTGDDADNPLFYKLNVDLVSIEHQDVTLYSTRRSELWNLLNTPKKMAPRQAIPS